MQGQPPGYQYTASEHAAVELALREPVSGTQSTATASLPRASSPGVTWPGIFPCPSRPVRRRRGNSGLPFKYVPRYVSHHERLPMFFVIGDKTPAAGNFIYEKYVKPLILKTWDITFVEYTAAAAKSSPKIRPRVRVDGPSSSRTVPEVVQGVDAARFRQPLLRHGDSRV